MWFIYSLSPLVAFPVAVGHCVGVLLHLCAVSVDFHTSHELVSQGIVSGGLVHFRAKLLAVVSSRGAGRQAHGSVCHCVVWCEGVGCDNVDV